MNKTDFLLNGYIDGDLTAEELNELNELLATDNTVRESLASYQSLNAGLFSLEHRGAPDVSDQVLKRLLIKTGDRAEQNILYSIVLFFTLALAALSYYAFKSDVFTTTIKLPGTDTGFFESLSELFSRYGGVLSSVSLPNGTSFILLAILTVLLYIVFEYHKEVKTLLSKKE